jgi:hypothetical protein
MWRQNLGHYLFQHYRKIEKFGDTIILERRWQFIVIKYTWLPVIHLEKFMYLLIKSMWWFFVVCVISANGRNLTSRWVYKVFSRWSKWQAFDKT